MIAPLVLGRFLGWTYDPGPDTGVRVPADRRLGVACPHCTNTDTLAPHCPSAGCRWLACTCGALVYARGRHRHPRHGRSDDTCHAPAAAA